MVCQLLQRPPYKRGVIERAITLMSLVLNYHRAVCTDGDSLELFE
jgi:hypothetical protein